MTISRVTNVIIILTLIVTAGCAGAQNKPSDRPVKKHNMTIPPMRYVGPEDQKIWEGEIDRKHVEHYRSKKGEAVADVIVVTQDNLPEYFKRIEYLDKGGDSTLDIVGMKLYDRAKGWRDVGITGDNKYGLGYAESKYRELLEKINQGSR